MKLIEWIKVSLVIVFISITVQLQAQSYFLGLNPPKLDWQQIETEKVEVIFPKNSEYQAQKVVNMVHMLYDSGYYSLGDKEKKVSIILQNQGVTSNGFVTVGPFRSEFYTNAPQLNFNGVSDWLDLLTIHEYRHVEQFTNAQRGVTKLASVLFGENAWGLFAGMALPRWFFEGDAVFYETILSNSGRGRMPEFENEYRAIVLEGRKFNYEKASATSIREFVPNHYNLGYLMTTYMRQKYGADVWEKVVQDAVRYRGVIYPFNRSLKKLTGQRSPGHYKDMIQELQEDWQNELDKIETTEFRKINTAKKRTFTNYRTPRFISENEYVVEKSSYKEIPTYYTINKEGKEKKLFKPGIYSTRNATLHVRGNYMTWSEQRFHARWGNKDYSVIMICKTDGSDNKQITTKTRYFAPQISPDLRKITAVHSPEDQRFELHILNAASGEAMSKFKMKSGEKISFPTWIDDHRIAYISKIKSQNAIHVIDIKTAEKEEVTDFLNDQISYLEYSNGHLFFSGTFSGVDNIYAISLDSKEILQVTSSKYGATQPDVDVSGKTIVYVDYASDGYNIASMELDPSNWRTLQKSFPTKVDLYEGIENQQNILNKVPSKSYEVKKFSTTEGLLQVHSWYPYFFPPNFSLEINADNKMSTFSAAASANYNVNENKTNFTASATYGEQFVALQAANTFGERQRYTPVYFETVVNTDSITPNVEIRTQNWIENDFRIGAILPLNLTFGNIFSSFTLSSHYHRIWVDYSDPQLGTNENFGALENEMRIYFLRRTARQHILPRIGLSFDINYRATLGTEANKADNFYTSARFYLPGLFKTHNFVINFAHQSEDFTSQYKFRDNFFYARGYSGTAHDRINRWGFNYHLPLLYPDLPVGPFFFIKRIKSNFFFDISTATRFPYDIRDFTNLTEGYSYRLSIGQSVNTYRSVGAELTFDFRFLRLLNMDLGVRYSRLLDEFTGNDGTGSVNQFDFIIRSIGY